MLGRILHKILEIHTSQFSPRIAIDERTNLRDGFAQDQGFFKRFSGFLKRFSPSFRLSRPRWSRRRFLSDPGPSSRKRKRKRPRFSLGCSPGCSRGCSPVLATVDHDGRPSILGQRRFHEKCRQSRSGIPRKMLGILPKILGIFSIPSSSGTTDDDDDEDKEERFHE